MLLLIIIIYIILVLLSKYILRDDFSFYFIAVFQTWFFLLLIISNYNPFSLREVSNYTYFLLIANIFFFSLGYLISRLTSKLNSINLNNNFIEDIVSFRPSKKFIFYLILFSALILNYLIKYKAIILLEGVAESRSMRFFVGKIFTSQIEVYFYNYIIETFSIFVSIYIAFSFVWRKYNFTFILSLFFVFLYTSFGSGRGYIIELGFLMGFFSLTRKFLMKNKHLEIPNKKYKPKSSLSNILLFFVLICFYLFSIYLSNLRNGVFEITFENFLEGNEYFANQVIIYCVGSFRALDYGITYLSHQFPTMYGKLSFGGIDELFGHSLNILGIDYLSGNSIYGALTIDNINIGSDIEYNALFTAVFVQYLDFGLVGVILFSFFWGFAYNRIINSFLRKPSLNKIFIISFLFIVCIGSVLSWRFQSPSACIFVLYLLIIEHKKLIKSKLRQLI